MGDSDMADALGNATRIHIVGIGGAGMSALARLLTGRGHSVTGSDAKDSPTLTALSAEGIRCWSGHRPAEITGVDLLVASSAVVEDDPELAAAVAGGVTVWRRPELLAAVTGGISTIGATGTHGKTSTTAMLISGARAAGLDPSFVVGGDLVGLGTNAAAGSNELLILEVDEAFGTFEHVSLDGLVVTNVEADHLDHFGSVDEVHAAFERVAQKVNGPVLACMDDPGSRRLVDVVGAIGYGVSSDAVWAVRDLLEGPDGSEFRLVGPDVEVAVSLPRPGVHMATNAAGALALLSHRGVDLAEAAAGLAHFRGVARRWEEKGSAGGVTVIDDYAHHPTEVAATLQAALRSGRRVVAVFQPHLYSRTALNAEGFGMALAKAHAVVVLDVYGAREEPMPGVDGFLVSQAVRDAGGAVVVDAPVRAEAAAVVMSLVSPGDLVVCMGAGDITDLASELVGLLEEKN
jgi:UDP-N-acetylmuramate--alanine ligase